MALLQAVPRKHPLINHSVWPTSMHGREYKQHTVPFISALGVEQMVCKHTELRAKHVDTIWLKLPFIQTMAFRQPLAPTILTHFLSSNTMRLQIQHSAHRLFRTLEEHLIHFLWLMLLTFSRHFHPSLSPLPSSVSTTAAVASKSSLRSYIRDWG